ncbi:MAG TPA: tRNA guanosine(34) transglycosylase Tgt [Gemmatimonadales bacterium]|nr:tRNA guanosine(34) transglycosylase Tgt [Gemmatimonadales bacterium]
MSFTFALEATAGAARAGTLTLPHGTVPTPAFMPVGTHGVVRGLSAADVRGTGARIILGNTYHLHLRPGESIVGDMGGLHRFTGWDRPMLTDSGGFQVFSLEQLRTISESGVEFRSHVDGTWRRLTPERATEIQWDLGADIAMAFDHVVPGGAPRELAEEGMERTLRWLGRCREEHERLAEGRGPRPRAPASQTLWPIIQGGTYDDLRLRSLEGVLARGPWTGIAIGGLSVGEPKPVMHRLLELLEPELPREVPRYLMGVGFPADLLEGIARGVDLFDCVAATRNGRHGTAWLPTGRINVRGAALKGSTEPLDPECDCEACTTVSRGYLRHLFVVEDMLGLRLVSIHNVRFLVRLGEQARARILDGTFDHWRREWLERHRSRAVPAEP